MDKITIIKETVSELLNRMNFQGEVFIDNAKEDSIMANIQTDQAGFLIGQAGASLDALQYVARILVSKKTSEPIRFVLDVNNYRKSRIDLLEELAQDIAKQALSKRVAVTLQPMPAYERRVIHLALGGYSQINTESIGEGEERRIVVKPVIK